MKKLFLVLFIIINIIFLQCSSIVEEDTTSIIKIEKSIRDRYKYCYTVKNNSESFVCNTFYFYSNQEYKIGDNLFKKEK
jgi:hypothetical protein